MKRISALILSLIMILSFSSFAYAVESTYLAKAAFVTDVNNTGSNLTNDSSESDNATYQDINIGITSVGASTLQVTMAINNEDVIISGTPVGRSENGKAIYFSADSSNTNFEIVHMAYVDGTETTLYFENYSDEIAANHVLKLYLRDTTSSTKDYIILECFEFDYPYFDSLADLPVDALMGSWFTSEFDPISHDMVLGPTTRLSDSESMTFLDIFMYMGHTTEQTITLTSYVTYSPIPRDSEERVIYTLEVTDKSIVCDEDPSIESTSESALHVSELGLRQTTSPSTAFVSEQIDGNVTRKGIGFGAVSASISVGVGPFGTSLSVPVSGFDLQGTVDIDENWRFFSNDPENDEMLRHNETILDSDFMLSHEEDSFTVSCYIMDYGGVRRTNQEHKAIWDITLENRTTWIYDDVNIYHYFDFDIT